MPEGRIAYRTVWLSDLHLGSRRCNGGAVARFLEAIEAETLYFVGDIIDGWAMRPRRPYWPASHSAALAAALRHAARARVVYIPGNHDAWLRALCGASPFGIEIAHHAVRVTALGARLLVMHGDELDRLPQAVARLGAALHERLARFRTIERAFAANPHPRFERAAAAEARRRGFDGIVCGHVHRPLIERVGGVLYCNIGDGVENCTALVERVDGTLSLVRYGTGRIVESETA